MDFKDHIRAAIEDVIEGGYPKARESTKWDLLIEETGRKLPPKVVLHRACERAGVAARRGGGWPTNDVLEQHGFTIVPKNPEAIQEAEDFLAGLDEEALRQAALRGQKEAPPKVQMLVETVGRSPAVGAYVKRLAQGQCDLCRQSAPFKTRRGPYLECHHIVPLAEGGPDTIENAVALCPNCHRRMHFVSAPADRASLQQRVKSRTK